jgi:hypothetical protein
VTHQGGLFRLRANHEAGRVAERDDRNVEGVAERNKTRRLIARIGINRTAEMLWIVS